MFERYRLSELPPSAKLFVAIFTTLMLLVCCWAVTIFVVEKIGANEEYIAPYEDERDTMESDLERQEDAELFAEDSGAVLAPIWDSDFAGREVLVDSVSNLEYFGRREAQMAKDAAEFYAEEPEFDENISLAHTHINGQTLLFFALGLVFLFTSVAARMKKIVYWVFGSAIVLHAIGLTGEDYHWFFDTILVITGAVIVLTILYMAFRIYADLVKSRSGAQSS